MPKQSLSDIFSFNQSKDSYKGPSSNSSMVQPSLSNAWIQCDSSKRKMGGTNVATTITSKSNSVIHAHRQIDSFTGSKCESQEGEHLKHPLMQKVLLPPLLNAQYTIDLLDQHHWHHLNKEDLTLDDDNFKPEIMTNANLMREHNPAQQMEFLNLNENKSSSTPNVCTQKLESQNPNENNNDSPLSNSDEVSCESSDNSFSPIRSLSSVMVSLDAINSKLTGKLEGKTSLIDVRCSPNCIDCDLDIKKVECVPKEKSGVLSSCTNGYTKAHLQDSLTPSSNGAVSTCSSSLIVRKGEGRQI
eukprot:14340925-Ditylum_brightwellii.AAC.1